MKIVYLALACCVLTIRCGYAQSIDDRIAAAATPTVLVQFAARADVCGDGRNFRFGDARMNTWIERCEHGPVRLRLQLEDGRIARLHTSVGGSRRAEPDATDLGEIDPAQAQAWLLGLARTAPAALAEAALTPAAIAAAPDPWRELLALATDAQRAVAVRERAVFWVGQSAAREATRELAAIVADDAQETEVKKAAVFALSRGDEPARSDHLLRIATTHSNAEVVAAAFFWLADAPDARALALFEKVLSASAD